jgi:hypothetical protein
MQDRKDQKQQEDLGRRSRRRIDDSFRWTELRKGRRKSSGLRARAKQAQLEGEAADAASQETGLPPHLNPNESLGLNETDERMAELVHEDENRECERRRGRPDNDCVGPAGVHPARKTVEPSVEHDWRRIDKCTPTL